MTNHHARTANVVDVVVVGAGMAGLTCAETLRAGGVDVLVLEGNDRVGGRTVTVEADGATLDLGGQFIGPGQDRVYALARELDVPVVTTHITGAHLVETDTGTRRWRGTVPRLSLPQLLDLAQAQARFERAARTIDPVAPWCSPDAAELDAQTVAGWIRRTLRTSGGRRMFTAASRLMWACEPSELSLLHALFYARAAGSLRAVISTEGGAQQAWLAAGELARRLAARLGDRVRLSTPVRRIAQNGTGVVVTAESGECVRASRVVVAIPPTLAGRIAYCPPLPAVRDGLTQRLAMGSATKCLLVYPEPFWRSAGLSGQVLSLRGPITGVVDGSPPAGGRGVLLGFVEGAAARRLAALPGDERKALVLDQMTRLFGVRAARPTGYLEQDWSAEPRSRGAYAALFPPGAWTQYGPALRPPVGRIHWAGTETASRWYGYIEGAIRSGEAAAAELIDGA